MKNTLLPSTIVVCLMFNPLTASAESTEEAKRMQRLPQINVLGTATDETLLTTPSSARFIQSEDLRREQPHSPQEALRSSGGAHVVDTEGYGFLPRIGMRGLNPDMSKKVLLLEDGAPVNLGPYTDPASYYSPTIDRMERIEVLKGSSSLRYGPSTIGGAINFITKDPMEMENSYRLFGGSRGHMGAFVEGAARTDRSAVSLTLGRQTGEGNRENNNFDVTDTILKYGMALSDEHYLGVKFSFYRNQLQATYLGLTQDLFDEDPYQNPAENDELTIQRLGMDVNHEWQLSPTTQLNTLFYSNTTQRDWWRENFLVAGGEINMLGSTSARLRSFTNMGVDSRLTWEHGLGGHRSQAEFGVRLHNEEMDNKRVNGVLATSRSGTIRDDEIRSAQALSTHFVNRFELGERWSLTPGVRVEAYTQQRQILRSGEIDVDRTTSVSNTETMPGLGVTYRLNPTTSAFFGAHRGFSPPRVQDAIDATGEAVQLEAERSTNMEIGIRQRSERLNYEATLFSLDFENQLIQASEAGGAAATLTNAGRSLHQGLELAGDYQFNSPIYLQVLWTYLPTAQLTSTRIIGGEDRNGNRLPYAPENLAQVGFGWRADQWSAGLQVAHTSEQYTDFENTREGSADGRRGVIPAYTLTNLTGRYQLNEDYEIYGNVRNLFDETYISSRAPQGIFPGLQRTVTVGLSGRF